MSDFGTFRRHWVALSIEGGMLVGVIVTFSQHNWKHFLASLFTLAVSFAPLLFERIFKVRIPTLYQFVYVLFVFASMFLGEVLHFYRDIRGWDASMHGISGVFVGLGIVLWLRALLKNSKRYRLPLGLQCLFVIGIAAIIAIAWEIVEFGSDQIFGTTSQDKSLYDTMTDLIYGMAGASLFVVLYRLLLKGSSAFGVKWVIERFERLNR